MIALIAPLVWRLVRESAASPQGGGHRRPPNSQSWISTPPVSSPIRASARSSRPPACSRLARPARLRPAPRLRARAIPRRGSAVAQLAGRRSGRRPALARTTTRNLGSSAAPANSHIVWPSRLSKRQTRCSPLHRRGCSAPARRTPALHRGQAGPGREGCRSRSLGRRRMWARGRSSSPRRRPYDQCCSSSSSSSRRASVPAASRL